MKNLLTLILLGMGLAAFGQQSELNLTTCHEQVLAQSPLQQQKVLSATLSELQQDNLKSRWLPQFSLQGQLAHQSDVFTFPLSLPGTELPEIPRTQYNLSLDINQTLYEGGAVKQAREMAAWQARQQQQSVEVNTFPLKSAVNQLYFSILLLDRQEEVLQSSLQSLRDREQQVAAGVKHGVMLPGSEDALKKQSLSLQQKLDQIETDRQSLRSMLADWLGKPSLEGVSLTEPTVDWPEQLATERPEQRMFSIQQEGLELQKDGTKIATRPKFSAFARGGVGNPNPFNFFETELSPFFQVGLRFKWSPWDWQQSKRQREQLSVQQQMIESQQASFERRLQNQLIQANGQVERVATLLEKDQQIMALQQRIVKQTASQLENGVATSADYVAELNALTQARLDYEIHQIQLIQAKINALTQAGKF
jgi:outer membrane protein TolC